MNSTFDRKLKLIVGTSFRQKQVLANPRKVRMGRQGVISHPPHLGGNTGVASGASPRNQQPRASPALVPLSLMSRLALRVADSQPSYSQTLATKLKTNAARPRKR